MVHRHLEHPEPLHPHQGRQKAMCPLEDHDVIHAFATEGTAGATGVGNALVGEFVSEAVGQLRGDFTHPIVMPVDSVAVDKIRFACLNPGDHRRQVVRIVLAVPVECGEDRAAGPPETGAYGARLAVAAVEPDEPMPLQVVGDALEDERGVVSGAIVYPDAFPGKGGGIEDVGDFTRELDDGFGFVLDGDHQADLRGRVTHGVCLQVRSSRAMPGVWVTSAFSLASRSWYCCASGEPRCSWM